MSTRKYLSGYENLLKKRKIEKQFESQKGSMDKFITNIKKKTQQKVWVKILQMNKKLIKKSWKIMKIEQKENSENSPNNIQTSDVSLFFI